MNHVFIKGQLAIRLILPVNLCPKCISDSVDLKTKRKAFDTVMAVRRHEEEKKILVKEMNHHWKYLSGSCWWKVCRASSRKSCGRAKNSRECYLQVLFGAESVSFLEDSAATDYDDEEYDIDWHVRWRVISMPGTSGPEAITSICMLGYLKCHAGTLLLMGLMDCWFFMLDSPLGVDLLHVHHQYCRSLIKTIVLTYRTCRWKPTENDNTPYTLT